jgi:Enoyl-(Acyl carrier protein) reductase
MRVALQGQKAAVAGAQGRLSEAVAKALTANGAAVGRETEGDIDIVVLISSGAETGPLADKALPEDSESDAFLALARRQGSKAKRIVHLISAAGVAAVRGASKFSARQAALASMTQSLAMELAPDCLVNAVAVGAFGEARADGAGRFVSHTALRRPARVEEIVAAVLFLVDPSNSYTCGHILTVDGGWAVGYARNF